MNTRKTKTRQHVVLSYPYLRVAGLFSYLLLTTAGLTATNHYVLAQAAQDAEYELSTTGHQSSTTVQARFTIGQP